MAIAHKRTQYEKAGYTFDPVVWLGERFSRYLPTGDYSATGSTINHHALDTERAWDAISLPYIQSDDYRDNICALLKTEAAIRGSSFIDLCPKSVKLISALAKAIDIPHTRGQTTIDLLANVKLYDQQRIARGRRHAENIILNHIRHTGEEIVVDGLRLSHSQVLAERKSFQERHDAYRQHYNNHRTIFSIDPKRPEYILTERPKRSSDISQGLPATTTTPHNRPESQQNTNVQRYIQPVTSVSRRRTLSHH